MPLIEAARILPKYGVWLPNVRILSNLSLMSKRQFRYSISVAHSEASPAQIECLMPYGLRLATHCQCHSDLPKYPECRGVCVDETVIIMMIFMLNYYDRRGIHVDPYMLRLVLKIKGKDKIILFRRMRI